MSKLMYFDFRCTDCGLKFDDLVNQEDTRIPCESCGEPAIRVMSTPNLSNKMESRHNIWVKQNRQKIEQDKKFYKDHGADKKHHSYGS